MMVNICYLLAFALHAITADLIHDVAKEKKQITLGCPHFVDGTVTWNSEINGTKVDILTHTGDKFVRHIKDPEKRYSTLADKSLFILRVQVSDSGRYSCNNEPAVDLTVIPSGIDIQNATEGNNTLLKCPRDVEGSHVPTWSRKIAGKQRQISQHASTVDKTLTIRNVQHNDFGLYFCDGKPAAYLNVTQSEKSDGVSRIIYSFLLGIGFLLFLIINTIIYFTCRRRFKSQETEIQCHIYDEIPEVKGIQPTNGVQPFAGPGCVYSLASYSGKSNETNPTYSTITDPPQTESKTKSPYLLIGARFPSGTKGASKPNDNTYVLVET